MAAGTPATATVTVAPVAGPAPGAPATATVNVVAAITSGTPATAAVTVTTVTAAGLFRYANGSIFRPGLFRYVNGQIVNLSDTGAASAAKPSMGYVGDSLTVGGFKNGLQDLLNGLGYGPSTLTISTDNTRAILEAAKLKADGLVGRSIVNGVSPYIPSSQDVINAWRSGGFHPTVWVVGLISNNFGQSKATIKTAVNTLLDLITAETTQKVMWIGPIVRPGSSLQSQVDANMYPALNEIVTERAGLVSLLNLQLAIRSLGLNEESPALWTDDRHMTPAGYQLRNQIIRDFIAAGLPS